MSAIADLPSLGAKSAQMLAAAGIDSEDQLRSMGSVAAFAAVRAAGLKPSLNLLWALESAMTGQRWQDIARTERARLLFALEDHQESSADDPPAVRS